MNQLGEEPAFPPPTNLNAHAHAENTVWFTRLGIRYMDLPVAMAVICCPMESSRVSVSVEEAVSLPLPLPCCAPRQC